ncbi:MAG: hypothetical protein SEPTF4163_005475 [Sporothrix epigloea]
MPPKAATAASHPTPFPEVEASALHQIFSPESIQSSLQYLNDPDNVESTIKAVRSATYGDPNKDAGAFWADLIDVVSLSTSSAVFCEESNVIAMLEYRARTALVAAYRTVFRHAGFAVDSHVSIYDLLQTAHSQQLTSRPALEVKRNCAVRARYSSIAMTFDSSQNTAEDDVVMSVVRSAHKAAASLMAVSSFAILKA